MKVHLYSLEPSAEMFSQFTIEGIHMNCGKGIYFGTGRKTKLISLNLVLIQLFT